MLIHDVPRPTRTIEYGGVSHTVRRAHPAADALPWLLDAPAFAEMIADMREHGFDPERPIVVCSATGLIVFGRRRELAAAVTNREPVYRFREFTDDEVVAIVRREELLRRDLNEVQRAAVLVKLADLLPHGARPGWASPGGQSSKLATLAEIAEESGAHVRTVQTLGKVKRESSELLDAVIEGKLPANTAARVAALAPEVRLSVAGADNPKAAAREAIRTAEADEPAGEDAGLEPGPDELLDDPFDDQGDDIFADDGVPVPPPPTGSHTPRTVEPKAKSKRPRRKAFHQDVLDDADALAIKVTRRYHTADPSDPLRDNLNRIGAMLLHKYAIEDGERSGAQCVALRLLRLAFKLAGPGHRKLSDAEFEARCRQALTADPTGYWASKRKAEAAA